MLISYQLSQTSVILRIKLRQDTTGAKPGNGITALTSASSGLIISTIADNEASPTVYTSAGSTIETVTTLGTFATPTSTKCRFKLVDNTNHPGIYEVQLANARYAVSSAKSLLVSITGVSGMSDCDVVIPLLSVNPYDGIAGGMTALPQAAAGANTGLPVVGTQVPNATAGATNGLLIAGSNAATTFATLTSTGAFTTGGFSAGAITCTTITASGAVAFQSTFAVTTSTSLAALSCTTLTASGAVAFQSTFAVTGTVTYNAFTVTNATTLSGAVSLGSTLTVTGTTTFTGVITGTNASNDLRINGAVPGATGGLFIAGTNAATVVTTSFTTTFTGNLTGNVGGSVASVTAAVVLPSIPSNWITAAGIASGAFVAAVWDGAISGHTTSGTFGGALNAAGSAGDPWATGLPGAYSAGTAGYIVGNALDTNVGSRMATYTQPSGFLAATFLASVGTALPLVNTSGKLWVLDGSGNALAPAGTALSTAQWTNTLATNLGTLAGHDPGSTLASHTDVTTLSSHGDSTWATATGFAVASSWTNSLATNLGTLAGHDPGATLASHADITSLSTQIGTPQQSGSAVTLPANPPSGFLVAASFNLSAFSAIADSTLRRHMANVEGSSFGDALNLSSLYGYIQMAQESSVSGTTLTVLKTDAATTLGTKTMIVTPGANPITGIS